MSERGKAYIEENLKIIDKKIRNKEDNVRGGLYMLGVGLVGIAYGALTKSDSSLFSGMIVSSGSLIFRAMNSISLEKLRMEQYTYRYALHYNNYDEYYSDEKGGKHFKK